MYFLTHTVFFIGYGHIFIINQSTVMHGELHVLHTDVVILSACCTQEHLFSTLFWKTCC